MANPIKASDLYQDDGALQDAIQQLELLAKSHENTLESIRKKAIQLDNSLKKVNSTTSEQRDEIKKIASETEQLEKQQVKYEQALSETNQQLQGLKTATREANKIAKLQAQLANSLEGSYDALSAQYALNKIALNKMSEEQRKNTKDGQALEKQTKAIYEQMNELQKATGKHTLQVGNYSKAFEGLTDKLENVGGASGSVVSGTKRMSSAFKALLANPVVLTISLIVGGLAALFNAFKKSEQGAALMTKVTGLMNGIMSQLVKLSVALAEKIKFAFENPQQALKNFGKLLLEQIVNRIKGAVAAVGALSKSLSELITGDFKGAKDAAKEAGQAFTQALTGLDSEQQKEFADAIKETTKNVIEETNAFIKLEAAKRRTIQANRGLIRSIEELTTVEQVNQNIADDTTKSFAEREKAAEKSREALEKRAKLEIQLAKNNLSLINQEISLRKNNGENVNALLDQQLGAYQSVIQAEREFTLAVQDNEKTRNELKQDRLERDLDILIDGFDNQKSINERLLQDENLTFDERAKIFKRTQELANESFAKQIETIQQFTGVQVDANDLIAESDAVVLNQKIRNLGLSEIIEGRLLEIVRERRVATLDLKEAEQELVKERNNVNATVIQSLDIEKLAIEQMIDSAATLIKQSKEEIQPERQDIYDLLGIDTSDEGKKAIQSSLSFAKQQLNEFLQARTELANVAVQKAQDETDAARQALEAEKELQSQGLKNDVENAKKRLSFAVETERKAQAEQEKAAKQQRAIQTIQQTGNLITASSKIFAQIGNPLIAIPLIALMFGSFIAAKVKSNQLAKATFAEGGLEILGGGSHASGNDTYLGFQKDGKPAFAEKGEAIAVINRKQTKKYRSILPELIKSINRGEFEEKFGKLTGYGQDVSLFVNNVNNFNSQKMENQLDTIISQNNERYFTDSQGRTVRQYKNLKTTFI